MFPTKLRPNRGLILIDSLTFPNDIHHNKYKITLFCFPKVVETGLMITHLKKRKNKDDQH